ncbi:MAG: glutamyl-tRNA reductase [Thiotrichales bacterium]
MSLLTIGINHKTAPVEIREKFVFNAEQLPETLSNLLALPKVEEASVLSTCNRTEITCWHRNESTPVELIAWLAQRHGQSPESLQPYLFTHHDSDAVRHMLRVACGLDSLVLGEPQILGQIKTAYQQALENKSIGRYLSRLYQHTFATAKQVRTDTAIGASAVSVAFAAVSLARQIFGSLEKQTALLIGAGETIELAARHLKSQHIKNIIVANRTLERAEVLASEFGGEAITLSDIPNALLRADIIITSTASQLPILGKGAVERALKKRKHKPFFMVDIAVPRDIEPEVGKLSDVYLYTVDDLHDVIKENLKTRQESAKQAEELVLAQVKTFDGWLQSQNAVHTIREFREAAHNLAQEVSLQALKLHQQGKSSEEALEYLAHTLTNKLLHHPTTAMNSAAREGRCEVIEAARELFDLDQPGKDKPAS